MKKFIFIIIFSLIVAFAVFAPPLFAKLIQMQFDIGLANELRADKVCLGTVCKTSW